MRTNATILLLGLALLGTACASITPEPPPTRVPARAPALPDDPVLFPPFPALVRAPASVPVVSSGRWGLPIMVFDPGIYVDDEGLHLFYTTPFCRERFSHSYTWDPAYPADCDIIDALGSIAYAFSGDSGRTWTFRRTPVVMPPASGFDSAKIETAFVFRIGDSLYLTYSADGDRNGEAFGSRYQIGVARLELRGESVRSVLLDESMQFIRRREPLLPYDLRPGRFDNNVQEPSVVVREGRVELYFIGLGLLDPERPVEAPGQAITSVGLGRAELDLDLNLLSRSDETLADGVNITEVRYFDGAYHMWASTLVHGEFHREEELTYATSADGLHFSEPTTILSPRRKPGWDNWGLMAPTVALERDRLILFYTAYESARHHCFPVRPKGRFGLPVLGGSRCLFATLGRAIGARPNVGEPTEAGHPRPATPRRPDHSLGQSTPDRGGR